EEKGLLSVCYRIFEFYSTEFLGICGQIRAIYSRPNMRFRYKISWYKKLTRRNAAAIAQYADLVGLSPEQLLNAFLQEFLVASVSGSADRKRRTVPAGLYVSGQSKSRKSSFVDQGAIIKAAYISHGRMHEFCS